MGYVLFSGMHILLAIFEIVLFVFAIHSLFIFIEDRIQLQLHLHLSFVVIICM